MGRRGEGDSPPLHRPKQERRRTKNPAALLIVLPANPGVAPQPSFPRKREPIPSPSPPSTHPSFRPNRRKYLLRLDETGTPSYVGRGDSLSRPSTLSREYVGRGDSLSRPSTLSREYVGRGDSLSRPSTLSRESMWSRHIHLINTEQLPAKSLPVPRYGGEPIPSAPVPPSTLSLFPHLGRGRLLVGRPTVDGGPSFPSTFSLDPSVIPATR